MKDAAKNMIALIAVVFALVVICAPFVFGAAVIYSLFHFVVKFW